MSQVETAIQRYENQCGTWHPRWRAVWCSGMIGGLYHRSGLLFIQHIKKYLLSLFYMVGTILVTANRVATPAFFFLALCSLASYITSLGLIFLTCKLAINTYQRREITLFCHEGNEDNPT